MMRTDTLQTTVGSNRLILAIDAPFGSGGTLLEWWGPSNIALASKSTANGYNGRMTVAPFVFDRTFPITLQATATPRFRSLMVPKGSGTYQVGTITVEAQNATATELDPIVRARRFHRHGAQPTSRPPSRPGSSTKRSSSGA